MEQESFQELPKPSDLPANFFDWIYRIKFYEKTIFVQHPTNGGHIALSELNPRQWAATIAKWWSEGMTPARVDMTEEQRTEAEGLKHVVDAAEQALAQESGGC